MIDAPKSHRSSDNRTASDSSNGPLPDRTAVLARYETAAQNRPWTPLQASQSAPDTDAQTVLSLFQSVSPDATALTYFDNTLTYGDLDRLSDRLAGWLTGRGIEAGARVVLVMQNTPQFVISTLAIWKVGAIVVSLNPMYRSTELGKLFNDCTPDAAICDRQQWDVVCAAAEGLINPENLLWACGTELQGRNDPRVLSAAPAGDLAQSLARVLREHDPSHVYAPADPEATCLILYTSGTTGLPKGAMLSHRNLVSNAIICRDHFDLNGDSRIFGLAPLFHITGFEVQIAAAFAAGAAQILTYRFHPAVALDAFREHHPTYMVGAITAFIALMEYPDTKPADFASFQHLFSGGAPISQATVETFADRFGQAIYPAYGMTELTSPSHLAPTGMTVPVDPVSNALSIGIPIPGTDVIVVNEDGEPVGVGEYGEIVVRGPGVTRGYWNRPDATDEALLHGWMHTGDIGFFNKDGWFFLIDRKKDMISASGFKVWPREVEDVLYAYPGVREAAVVGAPDAYRGETVLAYISCANGAQVDVESLRQYCREKLAAYKCPVTFHILEDLPKTATGKIMRNVLKDAG